MVIKSDVLTGNILKVYYLALHKNPVHNNPELKNTETRKNPEHIHKSRNPNWS
jgi:hypothetical protein